MVHRRMPPRMTEFAPTMFFLWVREAVLEKSFLDDLLDILWRFILRTFQEVKQGDKFEQH